MNISFNQDDNNFMISYYKNDVPRLVNENTINSLKEDKKEFKKLDLVAKRLNSTEWDKLLKAANKAQKEAFTAKSISKALTTFQEDRTKGKDVKNYSMVMVGDKVIVCKSGVHSLFLRIIGGRLNKAEEALKKYINENKYYNEMRLDDVNRLIENRKNDFDTFKREIPKIINDYYTICKIEGKNESESLKIKEKVDKLLKKFETLGYTEQDRSLGTLIAQYKEFNSDFDISYQEGKFSYIVNERLTNLSSNNLLSLKNEDQSGYNKVKEKCMNVNSDAWNKLEEEVEKQEKAHKR